MLSLLILTLFGFAAASMFTGDSSEDEGASFELEEQPDPTPPEGPQPPDDSERPTDPIEQGFITGEIGIGSNLDDIIGTSGSATVFAGDGNDEIRSFDRDGQDGGPVVYAEGGDDYILTRATDGEFFGGDGDDVLVQHDYAGATTLHGGAGDDSLRTIRSGVSYGDDGDDGDDYFSMGFQYFDSHGHFHSSSGGTAHGGEGDDFFSVTAGTAFGDEGDDQFFLKEGSSVIDAGDGDDQIFMSNDNTGGALITGGDGDDLFVFETRNSGGSQETTITDFTVGEDVLAIAIGHGVVPGYYTSAFPINTRDDDAFDSIEIRLSDDGTSTEILIGTRFGIDGETFPGRTIRLEGVTDFDESDLRLVETPGDLRGYVTDNRALPDVTLQEVSLFYGTDGADTGAAGTPGVTSLQYLGAGNDTLDAGDIDTYANLGLGDDQFTATSGTQHIYGETGDDSLTAGSGTTADLYDGDGSDTLIAAAGSLAILNGDDGDDLLVAEADDQIDQIFSGDGTDTIIAGVGDQIEVENGDKSITINVEQANLDLGPAVVKLRLYYDTYAEAQLTIDLNIPSEIQGQVSQVLIKDSWPDMIEYRVGDIPILRVPDYDTAFGHDRDVFAELGYPVVNVNFV